ncbi:TetR/AcrR family transcriptional regulator C-terminal domain-containing protein [Myxococcus sp. K15C18031901]|uniref:TetR/AcrR family transcriptional regulator n=1 Tax=Myxococcus dinghuensis TaxID=2906761 RepID=UPI0020A76B22|nr:TetR/AcrR family transcriptional regulator C-terminal domain-containing protein [Myxococcus dinghuensis]MCP3102497.1 TetR/AcrR family transcriptional regulator C-terminal domain-containing protein [Myxococcus dinghuensis]
MSDREKLEARLVWERPEPASRPAPEPLSREQIVRAAIALADADGLAAVSLRKVGASLDAGPMRLYGYLSSKEELLELMVDAVYGEMASEGPLTGDWRRALSAMAQRTRRAAKRHAWFIDLLGGRPHLGPHVLAHVEATFAALSGAPGFEHIDSVMLAVGTVDAYVLGALRNEASKLERGMNQAEWEAVSGPYIQRMISTGRFPMLAQVVRDATHPSADVVFERGLDCVLDGIAARLGR